MMFLFVFIMLLFIMFFHHVLIFIMFSNVCLVPQEEWVKRFKGKGAPPAVATAKAGGDVTGKAIKFVN